MSCLRYTREFMANFVQEYFALTRYMTFGAMFSEFSFPILCFLAPYDQYMYDKERRVHVRTYKSWRYIPALALSFFHLSLWATIRIPGLQIICASVPVMFIPGSFWDDLGWRPRSDNVEDDHPNRLLPGRAPRPASLKTWLGNRRNIVRTLVLCIMIPAMLMNYGKSMEWLNKTQPWGLGIVGIFSKGMQALFLDQDWQIFKDVPHETMGVLYMGYYEGANPRDARKDILAVFRENDWSNNTDIPFETFAEWSVEVNGNISAQIGHWRLESYLMEPDGLQSDGDDYFRTADWFRFDRLQYFICKWGNNQLAKANDPRRLKELELTLQMVNIQPPNRRYRLKRKQDIVYSFDCDSEPEESEVSTLASFPRSERRKYKPFSENMLKDYIETFDR